MSEQMRDEFEAWAAEEAEVRGVGETLGLLMDEHHDRYAMIWTQTAWIAWQASRKSSNSLHPLQQTLRENGDLIAAQATIAQQAQMIEHLRGGPTPGYTAVDMSTAAAQGFRDGVASMEPLRQALIECTASLEGEVLQKYHGQKPEDMHPVTRRGYERDMAEIEGYKALSKESGQ